MFVCVPEPVCHTDKGNSSRRFKLITWSQALTIAFENFLLINPRFWLANTAAFFCMPRAIMISLGILSFEILKFSNERCVWAPHIFLESIFFIPKLSDSVLFLFVIVC